MRIMLGFAEDRTLDRYFLGVSRSLTGRAWRARLDARGEAIATAIAQRGIASETLARVLVGRGVTIESAACAADRLVCRPPLALSALSRDVPAIDPARKSAGRACLFRMASLGISSKTVVPSSLVRECYRHSVSSKATGMPDRSSPELTSSPDWVVRTLPAKVKVLGLVRCTAASRRAPGSRGP